MVQTRVHGWDKKLCVEKKSLTGNMTRVRRIEVITECGKSTESLYNVEGWIQGRILWAVEAIVFLYVLE